MKRLILVFASLLLVGFFAACGVKNNSTNDKTTANKQQTPPHNKQDFINKGYMVQLAAGLNYYKKNHNGRFPASLHVLAKDIPLKLEKGCREYFKNIVYVKPDFIDPMCNISTEKQGKAAPEVGVACDQNGNIVFASGVVKTYKGENWIKNANNPELTKKYNELKIK